MTIEKINKTKSWLFEKIHKIDKSLAGMMKEGEKRQVTNITNERGDRYPDRLCRHQVDNKGTPQTALHTQIWHLQLNGAVVPLSGWKVKQTDMSYHGILLGNKNIMTTGPHNLDGSAGHYSDCKRPVPKGHILSDSVYVIFLKQRYYRNEKHGLPDLKMVVVGWRGGGMVWVWL